MAKRQPAMENLVNVWSLINGEVGLLVAHSCKTIHE